MRTIIACTKGQREVVGGTGRHASISTAGARPASVDQVVLAGCASHRHDGPPLPARSVISCLQRDIVSSCASLFPSIQSSVADLLIHAMTNVCIYYVCDTCPMPCLPLILRKVPSRPKTRARAGACVANSVTPKVGRPPSART